MAWVQATTGHGRLHRHQLVGPIARACGKVPRLACSRWARSSWSPCCGIGVKNSLWKATTVGHLVSVLLRPGADSGQIYRGIPGALGTRQTAGTRTSARHSGADLDVWPEGFLKGFSVLAAEVDRVLGSFKCKANFACIRGAVEIVADLNDGGLCHDWIVAPCISKVQLR